MSTPHDQVYWVWGAMIQRCMNEKNKYYKNYGGRGITVCERWRSSKLFILDMGPRPPGGCLERIDNDKGYNPDNCRWATRKEQNSNRRNCIYLVSDGEQMTLREYCRRHDLPYRPILKRVLYRGWPMNLAISAPMGSRLRALAEPLAMAG